MRATAFILRRALGAVRGDPAACLLVPVAAAGPVLVLAFFRYREVLEGAGLDDTELMFAISEVDGAVFLLLLAVGTCLAGPLAHRICLRGVGRTPTAGESVAAGVRALPPVLGYGFLTGVVAFFGLVLAASLAEPLRRLGGIDVPGDVVLLLGTAPAVVVGARLSLTVPLATLPRDGSGDAFRRSWDLTRGRRGLVTTLAAIWFYGGIAALFLPRRWIPTLSPDAWCALRSLWFGAGFMLGIAGVILAAVLCVALGGAGNGVEESGDGRSR